MPPPWQGSRPGWMELWAPWAGGRSPCSWQGGWNQMSFKVPSNPNHSVIRWLKVLKYICCNRADASGEASFACFHVSMNNLWFECCRGRWQADPISLLYRAEFVNNADSTLQLCVSIRCVVGKYSLNESRGKVKKKGSFAERCSFGIWNRSIWRDRSFYSGINTARVDLLFQFWSSFFRSQDTHGPELILPASIEFRESCE